MEKLWSAIKRNISFACGRVFRGYREFAAFFAALFVIETALCLLSFYSDSLLISRSGGKFDGNWHVVYYDMNEDQKNYMISYLPPRSANDMFDVVSYDKFKDEDGNERFNVYIKFTLRDLREAKAQFGKYVDKYLFMFGKPGESIKVSYSPLYKLYENRANAVFPSLLFVVCGFVLAALFIGVLYSVRTRQDRFVYGVYITCGADTKRLAITSSTELAVCAAVVYLPSAAVGAGLTALCNHISGGVFFFSFRYAFLVLPCVVGASFVAAYISTRSLVLVQPIDLISSRNSADLASSPRRSTYKVKRSFPHNYELISLWRFRRFIFLTSLSFALCASVFFMLATCSDVIKKRQLHSASSATEYTLTLNDPADFSLARNTLLQIPGVTHVGEEPITFDARSKSDLLEFANTSVISHELVAGSNVSSDRVLMDSFIVCAATSDTAQYLDGIYEVEGNIEDYKGEFAVIISESANNEQAFDFKPGDTITYWRFVTMRGAIDPTAQGADKIIQMTENYVYERMMFKVAAVVKNSPSTSSGITLYVPDELYERLEIQPPDRYVINISYDINSPVSETHAQVASLVSSWQLGTLSAVGGQTEALKLINEGSAVLLSAIGYAVLVASVLPLWYSMYLFYKKRNAEFSVLRAMFASKKSIFKMHIIDIPVFFLSSLAVSAPLCMLVIKLSVYVCDTVVPFFGIAEVPIISKTSISPIYFIVIVCTALLFISFASLMCYGTAIKSEKADEREKTLYAE